MQPLTTYTPHCRKTGFCRLAVLVASLWTASCGADTGFRTSDLWLESRGIRIPASWVVPEPLTAAAPWVIMAHGHGGSRDEAGGFRRLAEALALHGIASIRMDFPGCGESREALVENNLGNMLADWQAARDFVAVQTEVAAERLGVLGYSMGARVSLLASENEPSIKAMVLWAPVARDGASDMFTFVGGEAAWMQYREIAEQNGAAEITTPWGSQQTLSYQWFQKLETSQPEASLAGYRGPLLVLHGNADEVIKPDATIELLAAAGRPAGEMRLLPGVSHGLGFYDGVEPVAAEVLEATVDFFVANLKP